MESRTSPGKRGSVRPLSGFRVVSACYWFSVCTLFGLGWLAKADESQ